MERTSLRFRCVYSFKMLALISSLVLLLGHCNGSSHGMKSGNSSSEYVLKTRSGAYPGNITDVPFTVSIFSQLDYLGSGTLIRQNWVVTSASAVDGVDKSYLRVNVASNSSFTGSHVHKVVNVVIHEQYSSNVSFNIALLKLDSPVSPKTAKAISYISILPFKKFYGDFGTVTNYGLESWVKDEPFLHVYNVTILDNNVVRMYYNSSTLHFRLPDFIIGGDFNVYYRYCYGGGGDPLTRCVTPDLCQLIGIYNPILVSCSGISLFLDISYFNPWITHYINA